MTTTFCLQLILATVTDNGNSTSPKILSENNIKFLFEIQKKVDAICANYSGSMVSLQDICMKPLDKNCATQSVLQVYPKGRVCGSKMDPKNFDDYGGVEHLNYCFEHYSSTEQCMSAFKAPLDPSTVLGGFSGNDYSRASVFVVTYPVNNVVDKEGNGTRKALVPPC
ncbi:hypothetical protein V8G54_013224 [Vigna mungo]|uniref:NPC1 middle luminal domain-containing protein n=1 Tax=Vigna mungo TaxID=3915 RepID=A0AAQ3NUB4_VIGMU